VGELLAELILRYGEAAVMNWLAEKMRGGAITATPEGAGRCSCRDCSAARLGLELDPDDGCYYWELPDREQ
jgi:hypothetical protein